MNAQEGQALVDETAALLRRLLEAIERGELHATATMVASLAGALAALEHLAP